MRLLEYVDVSVATVWRRTSSPRARDRVALENPVDVRGWIRSLDTPARRALVGKIETQALFGEPVRVLERSGSWSHVVVPAQHTPKDARGYPGWVPSAQLTRSSRFGSLLETSTVAVVVRRSAWLRGLSRSIELSYGTRLPVVGRSGRDLLIATPRGETGRLARDAVSTKEPPPPSPTDITATARKFLGARYLWGGTAAFGLDCSGLIHLVFRTHGIALPRDADAQSELGMPVEWSELSAGDLLFYGRRHVSHVALFVGRGRMLESPDSSGVVRITAARRKNLAGARRYSFSV